MSDFSCLSDKRIKKYIKEGRVVIKPLVTKNINTSSVDVTLGKYYFREQRPQAGHTVYSPWSELDVKRVWGDSQCAVVASKYFKQVGLQLPEGISGGDLIILIGPQETILAHTKEFIGGRSGITTMMKARSSLGRNFIEVCKCAGWGDVGYINRWTMEITNNSTHYTIPLVVGRRIAQIVFFEVGATDVPDYAQDGKYQTTYSLNDIMEKWTPGDMLPKMWKDREVLSK